jgi:membrane protein required for colicin V production
MMTCAEHTCGRSYFAAMNFLDILFLIPLVWGFWRGFMKGLVVEAATLISFGLAVYGSIKLSDLLAGWMKDSLEWKSEYLPIIAFITIFLGILIIVYFITKMIEKAVESAALGVVNKIAGGAFGMLKFALVVSLILFVIEAVEKNVKVIPQEKKDGSLLYHPMAAVAPTVIPGLKDSRIGDMIPNKDSVEVGVDVNVKVKE